MMARAHLLGCAGFLRLQGEVTSQARVRANVDEIGGSLDAHLAQVKVGNLPGFIACHEVLDTDRCHGCIPSQNSP